MNTRQIVEEAEVGHTQCRGETEPQREGSMPSKQGGAGLVSASVTRKLAQPQGLVSLDPGTGGAGPAELIPWPLFPSAESETLS